MRTFLLLGIFALTGVGDAWAGHKAYPTVDPGISCPGDQVVWVNAKTGVYHLEGERWFGRTKEGKYLCQKAADKEGDRETRNGQ